MILLHGRVVTAAIPLYVDSVDGAIVMLQVVLEPDGDEVNAAPVDDGSYQVAGCRTAGHLRVLWTVTHQLLQ